MAAVVHGNAKETGMEKKINKISRQYCETENSVQCSRHQTQLGTIFFFGCCRFRAVLFPRWIMCTRFALRRWMARSGHEGGSWGTFYSLSLSLSLSLSFSVAVCRRYPDIFLLIERPLDPTVSATAGGTDSSNGGDDDNNKKKITKKKPATPTHSLSLSLFLVRFNSLPIGPSGSDSFPLPTDRLFLFQFGTRSDF